MQDKVNLFQFTDYRSFLGAYGDEKKRHNPHFSYGVWAKQLGLASTSALTMVLNGQRNPGKVFIQKLEKYFKFTRVEGEYFSDLIRLEKIKKDPHLHVLLMEKVAKKMPHRSFRVLDFKSFNAISKWYYYAIREAVNLKGFQNDEEWISKKLLYKVSIQDVSKAIQDLVSLNLLKKSKQGKLEESVGFVDTSHEVASEGLKRFHEQMIELAKESIRKTEVTDRSINGMTFVIDRKDLVVAKELIQKFQNEMSRIVGKKTGDSVYQFNLQLFPLTHTEK